MSESPPPSRRERKTSTVAPAPAAERVAETLSASPALPPTDSAAPAVPSTHGASPAVPRPRVEGERSAAGPTAAEQIAAGDAVDSERLPTAQLERAAFGEHVLPWTPPTPTAPPSVAPWALAIAILALVASLFAGVLLPLGVIGVVMSIISLRRAHDSRPVAIWALALAVVSIVFSAAWLLWALPQLSRF